MSSGTNLDLLPEDERISLGLTTDEQVAGYQPESPTEASAGTPIRPTSLTAIGSPPSMIEVLWKDNSSNEDGFVIQRSVNYQSWADYSAVAASATSFSDTGVQAGARYCYRLVVYNAAGSSKPSTQVCITLPSDLSTEDPAPATNPTSGTAAAAAPFRPTDLKLAVTSESGVQITWTDASADEEGFLLQRYDAKTRWTTLASVPADQAQFTDTAAVQGASYCYRVAAFNSSGGSVYTSPKCISVPKTTTVSTGSGGNTNTAITWTGPKIVPWVECNLDDTATVNTVVNGLISWQAVTDTAIVSSGATYEHVYLTLRQRVPGMRIIPGFKTSCTLYTRGFDSVEGWTLAAQSIQKMLANCNENTIILENETAMEAYIDGLYTVDMNRLREGLRQLPGGVEYLWYPSAGDKGAVLQKYLDVDRVVDEILDLRFVDHASLWGPDGVGASGTVNAVLWLESVAQETTIPLIYSINRDPWWPDARIPEAISYVEANWGTQSWAILYPGIAHWQAGAVSISQILLQQAASLSVPAQ